MNHGNNTRLFINEVATRDGFQRRHAQASAAATTTPAVMPQNGSRPRW